MLTLRCAAEFMANDYGLKSSDGEALGVVDRIVEAAESGDAEDIEIATCALDDFIAARGLKAEGRDFAA